MKPFLIWGGGGHGRVLADLIRVSGQRLVGFVDADPLKLDQVVEPGGGRVVLLEDQFLHVAGSPGTTGGERVALAIGNNRQRLRCFGRLDPSRFPPLVHPAAIVSPSAEIGPGSVVLAGAIVQAGARIEAAAIINSGAIVEHDCTVGAGAHVAPGATLAGGIRVGECCWVGAGATIIQYLEVGADTVIGAGAVVIRDIPAGRTVAGVPAKPLHTRGSVEPGS